MRWLNSQVSGSRTFFLLKRILLFSVILCLLVVFNLSFADEVTDPPPDWEHPWDDVCETDSDQGPVDPPESDGVILLNFGFDTWIMIFFQSSGQVNDVGEEKAVAPAGKNRGKSLILAR
jgi:hypothetical protein